MEGMDIPIVEHKDCPPGTIFVGNPNDMTTACWVPTGTEITPEVERAIEAAQRRIGRIDGLST